jgi:2-polyprenyl-6-methoxyphenol hydroxylase-like FAD-dependent oxidoreductase
MTRASAGEHAVVVGASMAGLLAAAAAAPHFVRVTLLEREQLPPVGQPRRGVPQGRHVHAFLPGGLRALDQVLPGLSEQMFRAGAIRCASMRQIRQVISGHEVTRDAVGPDNLLASRPFIEGQVRRRVLQLPNVTLCDGVGVHGLLARSDGRGVAGVRVSTQAGDDPIEADLVVVASGRAAHLPSWLEELGVVGPVEDELVIDLMYASRHVALPPGALGDDLLVLITPKPELPRGLGLFAQEDGTWLLTAVGWGKAHRPPTTDDEYLDFIGSFAPPDVVTALRAAQPLDDIVTHAFPASRRRRYDRLSDFPEGLLVIGDAISSFNPAYGQGMSVAALEAEALSGCLAKGTDRLATRYFRAIRGPVGVAWDMAVGADLALPDVAGPRPLGVRLSNAWVDRLLKAAEHDTHVAERFGAVAELLAPPTVLFAPRVVWRVLRARRRRGAIPSAGVRGPTDRGGATIVPMTYDEWLADH